MRYTIIHLYNVNKGKYVLGMPGMDTLTYYGHYEGNRWWTLILKKKCCDIGKH